MLFITLLHPVKPDDNIIIIKSQMNGNRKSYVLNRTISHRDFTEILSKHCKITPDDPCFYTKCSYNTKRKISGEFPKEEQTITSFSDFSKTQ